LLVNRVLVTGASGFIGSHCLEPLLARGYDVHAVASREIPFELEGVTWHRTDLLDDRARAALVSSVEPSHLLHLAWFVAPGKVIDAVINLDWTRASLGLYKEFVACGGRRMVTAGSSYEYDWRFGYCSEDVTPLAPDTVYGTCKKALGELVSAYAEACSLASAWARIFFLYGPREHPDRLVSSVVRSLLADAPAKCSHGEQIRDYLYVEDVGDALGAILASEVEGPVNVGSGRPIELRELVAAIGDKLEKPELIRLGAIPARANDAPLVVADVTRLADVVGWAPAYDLDAGLERTIRWWSDALVPAGRDGR
jgi:nucleoside-diphosphate-sugar epimerase